MCKDIIPESARPTQALKTGFYPVPHQLRLDLIRLKAPECAKDFMAYLADRTAGERCLYVLLSQRDILKDPMSGLNSWGSVSKAFKFCFEHDLLMEQSFGEYGTGYALAKSYWVLMLAAAPGLLPNWLVKIGPEKKFWPRYDPKRDPLLDKTPPAIEYEASGIEAAESEIPPASDRVASSITSCSEQYYDVKRAVTDREAGGDAAGQAPSALSESGASLDTYKDTYNIDTNKDKLRAPNVAHTHVEEREQGEADPPQGQEEDDFKGNTRATSPASLSKANEVSSYRQATVDKEQPLHPPTGPEETKVTPLPLETKASATARERTASPEAITQAADKEAASSAPSPAEHALAELKRMLWNKTGELRHAEGMHRKKPRDLLWPKVIERLQGEIEELKQQQDRLSLPSQPEASVTAREQQESPGAITQATSRPQDSLEALQARYNAELVRHDNLDAQAREEAEAFEPKLQAAVDRDDRQEYEDLWASMSCRVALEKSSRRLSRLQAEIMRRQRDGLALVV